MGREGRRGSRRSGEASKAGLAVPGIGTRLGAQGGYPRLTERAREEKGCRQPMQPSLLSLGAPEMPKKEYPSEGEGGRAGLKAENGWSSGN